MNFLNIFENHVAGILGAAQAPFSFKKLAKQTAREMEEQTLVVNGVNTAPALYTVLIANDDDPLMAPYYPELTRELSEFVKAQAQRRHYSFVGEPLVRFMIDPSLKAGKFSVFGENVDAPTLARLYEEERAYQSGISENTSTPAEPIAAEPEPEMEPQPCKQRPTPAQGKRWRERTRARGCLRWRRLCWCRRERLCVLHSRGCAHPGAQDRLTRDALWHGWRCRHRGHDGGHQHRV